MGVLLVRPTELVESLANAPLYEIPVLCCLALSASHILAQCSGHPLRRAPTTFCVLGLVLAVFLSHLHHSLSGGLDRVIEFLKVILSYLLIVAVLGTTNRFRQFLVWLLVFILILTALALSQHYEVIDNPALAAHREKARDKETGEEVGFHERLSGAGIFGNPNDLARILVVGIALSLYFLDGGAPAVLRPIWLGTIGVFGLALSLTMSRGGLIALAVTLAVLAFARFGTKRGVFLAGVLLAGMVIVVGGRLGDISTSSGTGQQRIQLWSEGLETMRSSPLFGVGMGNYEDITGGLGAHNSFVHAYVELGFFGGTLFFGAVFCSLWSCARLIRQESQVTDPALRRVGPYVFAILAGYAAGMLSSSRCYMIPTYLLLGLAVVYLRLAKGDVLLPSFRVNVRTAARLAGLSALFLLAIQVYVKASVRFGGS
jgi:O-antigen ligase